MGNAFYCVDYVCVNINNPYQYGFNGKEKENDVSQGDLDFGARIYDSKIGRWLSVDPLQKMYPSESPYIFSGDSPISIMDNDGKKKTYYITKVAADGSRTTIQVVKKYDVITKVTETTESVGLGGVTLYTAPAITNTETFDVAQNIIFYEKTGTVYVGKEYETTRRSNIESKRTVEDNAEQLSDYLSEQFSEGGGIVFYSSEGQGQETRKAGKNTDSQSEDIDLLVSVLGAASANTSGPAKTILEGFKKALDAIQIAKDVTEQILSKDKKEPMFKSSSDGDVVPASDTSEHAGDWTPVEK